MKFCVNNTVLVAALCLCSSASYGARQEQTPPPGSTEPGPAQSAQPDANTSAPQQPAPAGPQSSPEATQAAPEAPQTSPNPETSPSKEAPAAQGTTAPTKSSTTRHKAAPAPKPPVLHHTKSKTKKKPPQPAPAETPGKVVVKNGGAKEQSPQLTPSISPEQAQQQRLTITELLAATDANLKEVSARQLTAEEKSTVDQIHTYVRQSKAASATGDTNRAQTLADKARLLSEDLARK